MASGIISTSWQSSPEEKPRRNEQRKKLKDKRRSYTTSISISPTAHRSNSQSTNLNNNNDKQKPLQEHTICSGEVTLEISKGQFFVERKRDGRQLVRRQSNKEYSSSSKDIDKYGTDSGNIISVHNVGDLFPGTDHDVSYV